MISHASSSASSAAGARPAPARSSASGVPAVFVSVSHAAPSRRRVPRASHAAEGPGEAPQHPSSVQATISTLDLLLGVDSQQVAQELQQVEAAAVTAAAAAAVEAIPAEWTGLEDKELQRRLKLVSMPGLACHVCALICTDAARSGLIACTTRTCNSPANAPFISCHGPCARLQVRRKDMLAVRAAEMDAQMRREERRMHYLQRRLSKLRQQVGRGERPSFAVRPACSYRSCTLPCAQRSLRQTPPHQSTAPFPPCHPQRRELAAQQQEVVDAIDPEATAAARLAAQRAREAEEEADRREMVNVALGFWAFMALLAASKNLLTGELLQSIMWDGGFM